MKKIDLNGQWTLHYSKKQEKLPTTVKELEESGLACVPAVVPGNAHLDLSRAGILPEDLMFGLNVMEVRQYEYHEWWYSRSFDAPEDICGRRVTLDFGAVDCFAVYYLNGVMIGKSDNAFIEHSFEVTLNPGKNELVVHLLPTLLESYKYDRHVWSMIFADDYRHEFQCLRVPAHTFGWDIMPRCITPGIWRDVTLTVHDESEITDAYFYTNEYNEKEAWVICCVHIDASDRHYMTGKLQIEVEARCGDSHKLKRTKVYSNAITAHLMIPNPKLWWPKGYGEPNVYDATVRLTDGENVLAERGFSFGIRKVELDRTDTCDGINGRFCIRVNDTDIFACGSNWVGLNTFHSQDKSRYGEALALVDDSGCNILRIWGGAVYEDTEFYDFCDRHGVMVWQDFMMACTFYSQEDHFMDSMRKEARAVIKKLRNHPSIVLWSGDNECDDLRALPSGNRITRELLPEIIKYDDPSRPYLPSSPYIPDSVYEDAKRRRLKLADTVSENHIWGPRDYYKAPFYSNATACFISETGYHGCPDMKTLEKYISPECLWPYTDNREWFLHSTDNGCRRYRIEMMTKQIRQVFGYIPDDPDDYALASQISQAEAYKFFIERMKLRRPYTSGIIWWNLLDAWPQISDAVVGYYFDRKLAYDYIKRLQKPFVVMMADPKSWGSRVIGCNTSNTDYKGSYTVTDADTREVLASGEFEVKANQNADLGFVELFYSDKRMLLIEWEANGVKGHNHYLAGYPAYELEWYKKHLPEIQR